MPRPENVPGMPVVAITRPDPGDRFDLVLLPVRAEQLRNMLGVLIAMTDGSEVMFVGNAADRQAELVNVRLMVSGTRQVFHEFRYASNAEIPTNLCVPYRMTDVFVFGYWRRVLASARGELWVGPHSRAAREEMQTLAKQLSAAVHATRRATPDLDQLLSIPTDPLGDRCLPVHVGPAGPTVTW